MTEVRVRVVNLTDARRFAEVDMVVDSGAIYSVVPTGVLRRIGVEPEETQVFGLANGESVRRQLGDVRYEIGDRAKLHARPVARPHERAVELLLAAERHR